jgi:hypothetical protein
MKYSFNINCLVGASSYDIFMSVLQGIQIAKSRIYHVHGKIQDCNNRLHDMDYHLNSFNLILWKNFCFIISSYFIVIVIPCDLYYDNCQVSRLTTQLQFTGV